MPSFSKSTKKKPEKVKKISIGAATAKMNIEKGKLRKIRNDQAKAIDTVKKGDKKNSNITYFNLATAECVVFQAKIQEMLNKETFFDDQEDAVTQIKEAAMDCAEAILKMRYGENFSIEASEQTMDMPDPVPNKKVLSHENAFDPTEDEKAKFQKPKADSKPAVTDSKPAVTDSEESKPTSVAKVLFANLHADNRYGAGSYGAGSYGATSTVQAVTVWKL